MTIEFTVIGEPKPQPRPKAFARKFGEKWMARVYTEGTAEAWKSSIAAAAKDFVPMPPLQGPLQFEATYYLPRPKSHYRANGTLKITGPAWHVGRGDLDNLNKAVWDCLTQIGMWCDDGQVCAEVTSKQYADPHRMGAKIRIITLQQTTQSS